MPDNGRSRHHMNTVRHLPNTSPEIETALDACCPRRLATAIAEQRAGTLTVTLGSNEVDITLTGERPASTIVDIWQAVADAHSIGAAPGTRRIINLPAPIAGMTWQDNGRPIIINSTRRPRGARRRTLRGPAGMLPVLGILGEAGIKVAAIGSVASAIAFGSVPAVPPTAEAAPTPGVATPAVVTPPYTAWPLTPSTSPSPEAPRTRHDAPQPPTPAVPLPTAAPLAPQPTEGPSPSPEPSAASPEPAPETPSPAPSTDPPDPYAAPVDPPPSGPPADTAPAPAPSLEPSPEPTTAPAPEPPGATLTPAGGDGDERVPTVQEDASHGRSAAARG